MTEAHAVLDACTSDEAAALLLRCCGSRRWVGEMLRRRPFASRDGLLTAAREAWARSEPADLLEAVSAHPRIGEAPRAVGPMELWSREEQSVASPASGDTREALRVANARYEARFGFVFLVCATGRDAREILAILEARMANEPDAELRVAANELGKITLLRLEKLAR